MNTKRAIDEAIQDERFSLHDLLFEYKYLQSLQLVSRGITHAYNNIFTGLLGQATPRVLSYPSGENVPVLNELIDRGVHETEILFGFARLVQEPNTEQSLYGVLSAVQSALVAVSPRNRIKLRMGNNLIKVNGCFKSLFLMFFYLGENALQTSNEAITVTIEQSILSSDDGADWLEIDIRDDGPGILPSAQNELFMPLKTTKNGGHKGLGLFIARKIAESHGGSIQLKTSSALGSTFLVKLPVPTRSLHTEVVKAAEEAESVSKEISRAKLVFFVIDDDPLLLDFIVHGLQRRNHIVFSASNCAEAIDEFKMVSDIVDIFLVDIGLSDIDGIECVKQLHSVKEEAKIIFMSGDNVDPEECFSAKASFVAKPFKIKQVEEMAYNVTAKL